MALQHILLILAWKTMKHFNLRLHEAIRFSTPCVLPWSLSQLKQDGSASTVVLPLLVELIDSAVQLGCASSSSQHILKHLLQMLMREDADVSIQFFIKNAGAFAVGSSHSADAMEALQRYTDVLFRARGALPDHFDDSSLNRMVASISQVIISTISRCRRILNWIILDSI